MKSKLKILLLLFVLIYGCAKKPYPDSVSMNEPQYGMSANIGGSLVSITAGVDNYYLYSAKQADKLGVQVLSSEFKNKECSTCNTLKIEMRDVQVNTQGTIKADTTLRHGLYSYIESGDSIAYLVSFTSRYNQSLFKMEWDFGDGSTSTAHGTQHVYQRSGVYKVKLKAISTNGCESTTENEITVGSTPEFANIIVIDSLGTKFYFAEHTGNGPFHYTWQFGNGDTLGTKSKMVSYTHPVHGSYLVTLTITDGNGKKTYVRSNVVTSGDLSSCAVNMRLKALGTTPRFDFSKIKITWMDAKGITWSSVGNQSNSSFELLQYEPDGTNELGQSIYKVKVKFNCTLYAGGASQQIKDGIATLAFPIN